VIGRTAVLTWSLLLVGAVTSCGQTSRSGPTAKEASPAGKVVAPASRSTAGKPPPHVVVVVEENRSAAAVLGSTSAPYINQLARSHGIATASYGQSHPSLPNYLELISGSTHGVTDDGTGYRFDGETLVDQLAAAGVSWRAYMEDLPSPCFSGPESGGYAKKHDPFVYFSSILGSAAQCDQVVPFSQLPADMRAAKLPSFVWISPNLCDDGHDCSTAHMDTWLRANLQPLLSSQWFAQDGVAIITWDEGADEAGCCEGAHGGRVPTVVVSTRIQAPLSSDKPVDQAGVLRSIEDLYSLPPLGDAACACSGDLDALITPP
jgi:phosphatidylinositol-3-phosphatase